MQWVEKFWNVLSSKWLKENWAHPFSPNEGPEALTEFFPEPSSKPLGQVHSMLPKWSLSGTAPTCVFISSSPQTWITLLAWQRDGFDSARIFFIFIFHYYYCTSHAVPIIRRKHPSWRTSTGKKKWSRWWKQAEVATGRWCTGIDTWKVKRKY